MTFEPFAENLGTLRTYVSRLENVNFVTLLFYYSPIAEYSIRYENPFSDLLRVF